MNGKRRLLFGLAAAQILLICACRKSSEPTPTSTPQFSPAAAPTSKERHHRMFTGGVSPLIVSMSPETIRIHDGHVPPTRFSLAYEINGAEKASKAYISVYSDGVGELQRFDVDVQPKAQIDFLLDASDFDLGPTVRFRAHCPYGDTDWFLMGSDPIPYPQRMSSREIASVYPSYLPHGRGPSGGSLAITLWGGQFTKACTPEAQIDFSGVDLENVVANDKEIKAVMATDKLSGRPVTLRHLDIKLVVNGPGMPAEDIYNLNFVE
jgi:hypothetical protein